VKTGREGICSLVSCAGGREGVVSFGVDARRWEEGKNEKKKLKSGTSGGRSDAELRESVHCIRARYRTCRNFVPLFTIPPSPARLAKLSKRYR
jgi:hypothetical protein